MSSTTAINTLNIIATQLQNLLNVHVTKYINTGDRVVDNGITLIINSSFALIGGLLYAGIIKLTYYIYNRYYLKRKPETDCPTDINISEIDYSNIRIDTITKFIIRCNVTHNIYVDEQITPKILHMWLEHNFKDIHMSKQIGYWAANGIASKGETSASLDGYFMPIWKYKNNKNEWEYVWIVNEYIYSNDYSAMDQCLKAIYAFYKAQKVINTISKNDKEKSYTIYDINSTGQLDNIGTMNPNKTFDSLFYDKKNDLIHVLNKFIKGKMYPAGMCDNKLGILLYGPPGTGKTGTITALANYTKRNVVMVKHTSKADLENLKKVIKSNSLKSIIIVFDEFDHIICEKPSTSNINANDYMKEFKIRQLREELRDTPEDDKEERKRIQQEIKDLRENKHIDKNEDISIGDFIQFLDGVEDQTGRLIVATTNYPNKINPILLRPGRFDLKLELGYCSMQMFCDIVNKVFPENITKLEELTYTQTLGVEATANSDSFKSSSNIEIVQTITVSMKSHIASLLEKRITPLNLINICLQSKSFDDIIELLNELPPDTFDCNASK